MTRQMILAAAAATASMILGGCVASDEPPFDPRGMTAQQREAAKGHCLPADMDGGEANPLGARDMYLGTTQYRIHGTNAHWTIGYAVSSGCIRMRNQDVVDLYERVGVGTRVIVM